MIVLFDINVILDVLLQRSPWADDAAAAWDAHNANRLKAHVAAFSIPTIFYVVRRQNDLLSAHEAVRVCLETLEVIPVVRSTLELAHRQTISDYEDALQIASAIEAGVDAIVTRDPTGFGQLFRTISPTDLLAQLPPEKGTRT